MTGVRARRVVVVRSLSIAALFVALASPTLTAQRTPPLTVGLLRVDGTAIPFAHWTGSAWIELPRDTVATLVHDIKRWHLFTDRGFRAIGGGDAVDLVEDSGYEDWGQRTSLWPRDFDRGAGYPIARLGLVLTRPEAFVPVRAVGARDRVRKQLTPMLRAELDRQDSATTGFAEERLPASERVRPPMRLHKLEVSRGRIGGRRVYFYSAHRDYPRCETGALEGFAVEERGTLRLVGPRFAMGDCDGKGRARLKVYGILPMREGVFVIGEEHYWEGVGRVVLELTESEVRRVVPRPWPRIRHREEGQ